MPQNVGGIHGGGTLSRSAILDVMVRLESQQAELALKAYHNNAYLATYNAVKKQGALWKEGNKEILKGQESVINGLRAQAQSLHYLSNAMSLFAAASATAFGFMLKSAAESHQVLVGTKALFTGMLGSEQAATKQMQELEQAAFKTNVPILDMYESAKELGPTLKLAGMEMSRLTEATDVARRLSVLNPSQGTKGAAFAISEFLQGETRSLRTRFRISPAQIDKFLEMAKGDKLKAIGLLLDSIGVTSETASGSMANLQVAFENFGQTLGKFMASGPEPFIKDFLIPLLNGLSRAINTFQQVNPELARFVSIATGISLVVLPAVFSVLKMAEAYKDLQLALIAFTTAKKAANAAEAASTVAGAVGAGGTGAVGAGVAAAGVGALALTIGAAIGVGLVNIVKNASKAPGEKPETLAETANGVLKTIQQILTISVRLGTEWEKLLASFGAFLLDMVGRAFIDLALVIRRVASQLYTAFPVLGRALADTAYAFEKFGYGIRKSAKDIKTALNTFWDDVVLWVAGIERAKTGINPEGVGGLSPDQRGEVTNKGITASEEAFSSFEAYYKQVEDLKDKHLKTLADIKKAYDKAFGDENARNLENNLSLFQQLQDDYADIDSSHAKRMAKLQKDNVKQREELEVTHSSNIAKIQQDAREDDAKRLADFQTRMRRMKEDHDDALADAAYRLDALGVIREMQSYAKQKRRAEEDFAAENAQQRSELAKKLATEQEHYAASLAELQKNNNEAIAEENQRYREERQAAYDNWVKKSADEARRHQLELNRLWADFQDKLRQENIAYQYEKNALLRAETEKQMALLGIQTAGAARIKSAFADFWKDMLAIATGRPQGGSTGSPTPYISGGGTGSGNNGGPGLFHMARGGDVTQTGPKWLEAGEHVINPQTAWALRAKGGDITPQRLLGENGGRSYSFTFGNISGMGYPDEIARAIEKRIVDTIVEEIS